MTSFLAARRPLAAMTATGALLAGGLLVASPAGAGLTSATVLAPAGGSVVVATDTAGNAAAAWVAAGQVQVSRRTAGTPAWTPAVTVSPAGVIAADPDVSVGPEGTVAVVWAGAAPGVSPSVGIAMLPPGQAWVPARPVSTDPVWADRDPQVEVGPAGVATVVWAATRTLDGFSTVRSKTASAASISSVTALFPNPVAATVFSGLSLARNASGDTVAAWRREGASGAVEVARRLSGQDWSTAQPVVTGTLVPDATSVAIDGSGNATSGWSSGASEAAALPYIASWPRGAGAPGAASTLSVAPGRQVQVAAARAGLLAAAWTGAAGLTYVDTGSAPVVVAGGSIAAHALALSDTGAATVAYAPAGAGLSLAHRPGPTAAWSGLAAPSAAGSVPAVAAHGADATLVWSEGGSGAVQARTLDNGAPFAVHLTAPMRVLNDGKRIRAGWIGADTWSPITYEVQRQVGTHRTPLGPASTWVSTTATDAAMTAKPGETMCLRVRGADTAGNTSAWSVPRCATVAVNDKTLGKLKLKGRTVWRTQRKARGSYSRDYTVGSRRGATLTLPVRARRVALLVSTGRGHGSVSVSLGKSRLGTYSLASARAATQVVVPVAVFSGVRKGTLKISVTTQGKPVRIDGVYAGPS